MSEQDAASTPPGFIIAAPHSGAGKTTVSLGLMRALKDMGETVQPFKCGPDYIDPAFHGAAAGRASYNLDTWAMRQGLIESIVHDQSAGASLIVAEGVMGLFDGVTEPGQCARASTADLSALTGWPIVLVLDVSGQAETAAALALGCARYRPEIEIAGVILNRVASPRHERLITPALEAIGMRCFGSLSRNDDLALPGRHLGLVQAGETEDLDTKLDVIARALRAGVRVDALVASARPCTLRPPKDGAINLPPPGQRIALARDAAFSFTYPHVLAGWRSAGAEVMPFSPLADEPPDANADAVWLPGGYPELHAGALASASRFRQGLATLAAKGVPVHGECGGYMVLGAGLEDAKGARHAMTGLLGVETSFAKRKLHLGYRRARLLASSALGPAGTEVYGHEFHYAALAANPDEPLVAAEDAGRGPVPEAGSRRGSVSGTFFHVIDRAA